MIENLNPKVLALVVSYNRLEMLKECLASIKEQTYRNFDILVVNNGSTDGTKEYLETLKDISVINQENVGGAGGFYAGMKYMFDRKEYDALWMMDDDGLADSHQLEYLVFYSNKYNIDYSNALLLNRDERNIVNDTKEVYDKKKMDELEYINSYVCPFNGTYCNRKVIEIVGFIKKEMFIWGDEREYTLRIIKNGLKTGTVTKAIHYHPFFKGNYRHVIPGIWKAKVSLKPKGMDKYFYKNLGFIDATYNKKNGFAYVVSFLVRLDLFSLFRFLKYYIKGRKNKY